MSTTTETSTETNIPEPALEEVEAEETEEQEELEDPGTRIARLFLEDYVVTMLLRHGRALRPSEIIAGQPGFSLSRAGLRAGLQSSKRVIHTEREWEWTLRAERAALSREEKSRQPLASALEDLLIAIGKPVNAQIIVREMAELRSMLPANIKAPVENLLRDARFAANVNETTWLHSNYLLDPGAPTAELVRRENKIENDPDWLDLQEMPLPEPNGTLTERAVELLETVGQPLSRRLLGYLLWNQTPDKVTRRNLLDMMSDREHFVSLIGGYITLKSQLPQWRGLVEDWLSEMGASLPEVDAIALLRQRLAPSQIITPKESDLEAVKKFARRGVNQGGIQPFDVAGALLQALEIEADDPQYAGTLQGLNDALRRDTSYLPLGIGRFILREAVPANVGQVLEILRPINLELRNAETNEPLDMELTDDGLEGDAVEFVHSPFWEEVNEEIEVRHPKRPNNLETKIVVLNHHLRAGTLKLRRMDDDFWGIEGNLTRLPIFVEADGKEETLAAWASRESGLIYGLGDWLSPRLPASGGSLLFERGANGFRLTLGEPDKATFIAPERLEALEAMREASKFLSLYELLQNIMADLQDAEIATVWAHINVVRRTSKRLLASVLCAYSCFYFKKRGPEQFFWHFAADRVDQGFKRNKRKFVRR
ncbi:MAG TPA: hypothetical protein VGB77_15675 [Abditibacteriaceae bacterium]|jgi:hypothetical protein